MTLIGGAHWEYKKDFNYLDLNYAYGPFSFVYCYWVYVYIILRGRIVTYFLNEILSLKRILQLNFIMAEKNKHWVLLGVLLVVVYFWLVLYETSKFLLCSSLIKKASVKLVLLYCHHSFIFKASPEICLLVPSGT